MAIRSRRQFLSASAAIAAAPFISTSATRARAQASRKLGFALCGLGRLSEHQLAPALAKTRHCRLTGLVTGTPAKAAAYQAKYGVPAGSVYAYEDMQRMADNPDIDVVCVITPNALHAEHTLAAARAGKHVFCEKPMEISVERCERMIQACKEADRKLAIGYRCQFEPHHIECMRLARERTFGAPSVIEAGFAIDIGDPDQWRLKRALAGGGALVDVGIYALQAMRYLAGEEPVEVTAMATTTDRVKFAEVEETMVWTLRFPSGVVAHGSTSYRMGGIQNLRLVAREGWFELDPAYSYDGIGGRRSDGKPIAFPQVDQFATELDDFALCILEGRESRVPGEEGLRDVRIMQALYEAARTGKAVSLA